MVLRLWCVKRGLTANFICDMVVRKMNGKSRSQDETGNFSSELWDQL